MEELRQYEILDTAPEAAFDAITALVAQLLDTPIALVSLVDSHRQWFKSRFGLDAKETSRDISFCGHVVADQEVLIVNDAYADARFADNPLVTGDPRVRFYVGMPLRTKNGAILGTLCAIDHEPRELTTKQREILAILASQVVALLEWRRSARLLSENEDRLRTVLESMTEGVVLQDRTGAIVACNSAAPGVLGLTEDQLKGRTSMDPAWRAVHEDGTPFPGDTHPAMVALRTGQPLDDVVMGIHKPNGELSWLSINARPLFRPAASEAHAVTCIFRDITERMLASARARHLAQHERLITTGTLAAGVGHEINNPLTFVLANIDFVVEELRNIAGGSPAGRLKELIEVLAESREGAERIRKIVRGLKALAREEVIPVPTDVHTAVEIALNLAMHEIRQRATPRIEIASGIPPVLADDSRLIQVLVNLLVNAGQCFATSDPAGNSVVVRASVVDGKEVSISVSDNGPGIPPNIFSRIFDPFFTTKPIGQGTGLGLSISHSIVLALGGELRCETTVGHGTSFFVKLPIAPESPGVTAEPRGHPTTPRGRVLIVDDEAAAARSLERLLQSEHEVVALSDPREVLARLEAGESFDVIFCDLVMPYLSGADLYHRVLSTRPQVAARFVFMTGGVVSEEMDAFMSSISNERLEKPFSSQNLRGIARRFTRPLSARERF